MVTVWPIDRSLPKVFGGGMEALLAVGLSLLAGFMALRSGPAGIVVTLPPFAETVATLVVRATNTPAFSLCAVFRRKRYARWIWTILPDLASPPYSFTTSSTRISEPFRSVATACLRLSSLFEIWDGIPFGSGCFGPEQPMILDRL